MRVSIRMFALALFLLGGHFAGAAGLIIVEDKSWWPGPVPPDHHPIPPPWPPPEFRPRPRPYPFAPLEVHSLDVKTRIQDQVAETRIEQAFFNPNAARLEGTFLFPIPAGAHLDKFSMEIEGKQVEAELLKADKARRIYEDIVRSMKDPALLEYAGRDLLKVRIFPIEPQSKKRITLVYTQLLKADDGLVRFALPLNTEKYSAKPLKNVSVAVDLTTREPLKTIYSPSHKVEVKRDGPRKATAAYEASNAAGDEDFVLYFAPEKDEIGANLLTCRQPGEDGYFLWLASPGVDVAPKQVIQKDIIFVLDTSGSMAGKKLEQAKKALLFCIENLNDGDRFEILRFSTDVESLFDGLIENGKDNRDKAAKFVDGLRPTGGTAINDALRKAMTVRAETSRGRRQTDARPLQVIFLTDGRPTIGESDEAKILDHLKQADPGKTRVFCFGIGTDVNTHLLDRITEETRAFSQYVLPDEDLEIKVSTFFAKIKEPVLADPTLKFGGDLRITKMYPTPLPDLFKGSQLVVAGRYSGSGHASLTLEGTVNGKQQHFTYEAEFPQKTSEHDFIPRLWATRRVGYLLDEIRLHSENEELREEVTDLARKYGIVTPYTAHLIVEDETRRNVATAGRSLRVLEENLELRREAAQTYDQFKTERGGQGGVASSQYSLELKSADAAAPAAAGGATRFSRAYGIAPSASGPISGNAPMQPSGKARLLEYSQQTARHVSGKTFFLNDNVWVDSDTQKLAPSTPTKRLEFGSPDYFAFLQANPQAASWLALGQKVRFAWNRQLIEVH